MWIYQDCLHACHMIEVSWISVGNKSLSLEAQPLILYMSIVYPLCHIVLFHKTNMAFICPIPEERIRKGTESSPVGTQDKCYPVRAFACTPLHTNKSILFCTNNVIAALLLYKRATTTKKYGIRCCCVAFQVRAEQTQRPPHPTPPTNYIMSAAF